MEVIVLDSPDRVASLLADHLCRFVESKPTAVLGLATGRTPIRTYDRLALLAARRNVSFTSAYAVMLDEYLGLSNDHPGLFRNELRTHIRQLGIPEDHLVTLPNEWPDTDLVDEALRVACEQFEDRIMQLGGVDVQVLGVSAHGHIGFNEPTSSFASRTRVKTLTSQTVAANADSFATVRWPSPGGDPLDVQVSVGDGDVPVHVITQGIATILESRHAILIATGAEKADIVSRAVEGPLTSFVPASALQLHRHATVLLDEDAASGLALLEYYREVQRNKQFIQPPIT